MTTVSRDLESRHLHAALDLGHDEHLTMLLSPEESASLAHQDAQARVTVIEKMAKAGRFRPLAAQAWVTAVNTHYGGNALAMVLDNFAKVPFGLKTGLEEVQTEANLEMKLPPIQERILWWYRIGGILRAVSGLLVLILALAMLNYYNTTVTDDFTGHIHVLREYNHLLVVSVVSTVIGIFWTIISLNDIGPTWLGSLARTNVGGMRALYGAVSEFFFVYTAAQLLGQTSIGAICAWAALSMARIGSIYAFEWDNSYLTKLRHTKGPDYVEHVADKGISAVYHNYIFAWAAILGTWTALFVAAFGALMAMTVAVMTTDPRYWVIIVVVSLGALVDILNMFFSGARFFMYNGGLIKWFRQGYNYDLFFFASTNFRDLAVLWCMYLAAATYTVALGATTAYTIPSLVL